jgi:hypothetical protein
MRGLDDASYTTPAEFEAVYYRKSRPALEAATHTRAVIRPGAIHLAVDTSV